MHSTHILWYNFDGKKNPLYMRTQYVQDKGDGPLDLFGGIAGGSATAVLVGDTQKREAGLVGFDDEEVRLDGWAGIYVSYRLSYPSLCHDSRSVLLYSLLSWLLLCLHASCVICPFSFASKLSGMEVLACLKLEEGARDKFDRISQVEEHCVQLLTHKIALWWRGECLASKFYRLHDGSTAIYRRGSLVCHV